MVLPLSNHFLIVFGYYAEKKSYYAFDKGKLVFNRFLLAVRNSFLRCLPEVR